MNQTEPLSLKGKRVLLTGGGGFLGQHLLSRLEGRGATVVAPRSKDFDLRTPSRVDALFDAYRPEIVIHAAVHGGGIGYMQRHPAEVCYDNLMMNTLLVEASYRQGCEKFVGVGTICSYPKYTPVPFNERDLWNGYPEETNGAYGMAKKMMLVQTQSYAQQYGFNGIHLLLVNMYGPKDDFSEQSSHVIPAFIKRFWNAKEQRLPEVTCWGDGTASREFLFVDDAADGIVLATERYHHSDPINLGNGHEMTIAELATEIARAIGYRGEIRWDPSKPNGQPRRCLDVSSAREQFGFVADTPFDIGLQRTIDWYVRNVIRSDS